MAYRSGERIRTYHAAATCPGRDNPAWMDCKRSNRLRNSDYCRFLFVLVRVMRVDRTITSHKKNDPRTNTNETPLAHSSLYAVRSGSDAHYLREINDSHYFSRLE